MKKDLLTLLANVKIIALRIIRHPATLPPAIVIGCAAIIYFAVQPFSATASTPVPSKDITVMSYNILTNNVVNGKNTATVSSLNTPGVSEK